MGISPKGGGLVAHFLTTADTMGQALSRTLLVARACHLLLVPLTTTSSLALGLVIARQRHPEKGMCSQASHGNLTNW